MIYIKNTKYWNIFSSFMYYNRNVLEKAQYELSCDPHMVFIWMVFIWIIFIWMVLASAIEKKFIGHCARDSHEGTLTYKIVNFWLWFHLYAKIFFIGLRHMQYYKFILSPMWKPHSNPHFIQKIVTLFLH